MMFPCKPMESMATLTYFPCHIMRRVPSSRFAGEMEMSLTWERVTNSVFSSGDLKWSLVTTSMVLSCPFFCSSS